MVKIDNFQRRIYEGRKIFTDGEFGSMVIANLEKQKDYLQDRLKKAKDWNEFCEIRGRMDELDRALFILLKEEHFSSN